MLIALIIVSVALLGAILWSAMLKTSNVRLEEKLTAKSEELIRINDETQARLTEMKENCDVRIMETIEESEKRLNEWKQECERREQREAELAAEREQSFKAQFKAIAAEAIAAQSTSLREQQENRLSLILNPFKEELDGFRKTVTERYAEESRQRFSLTEHINRLIETNNSLGREARELSLALKRDSKVQGNWGEMVLESILEKSGLKRGEEYTVQATTDAHGNTYKNEDGTLLRPDVVLHYPSRGDVIIDSKVSLKSYIDYVNAEDDATRALAMNGHLKSVRAHIRELRDKRYQDFINSLTGERTLEFVMMFIPNEGAYLEAMNADASLWEEALESRVIIVSPTHLVSVLGMIQQLWAENRRNRNAIEIAEAAGKMYEKFVGFVADMEKIKKSLDGADKAYRDAMNKLQDGRGNLIKRAEDLKELGAKTSKQLPGS